MTSWTFSRSDFSESVIRFCKTDFIYDYNMQDYGRVYDYLFFSARVNRTIVCLDRDNAVTTEI